MEFITQLERPNIFSPHLTQLKVSLNTFEEKSYRGQAQKTFAGAVLPNQRVLFLPTFTKGAGLISWLQFPEPRK